MQLANDEERYGLISKAFHWLIAVMILGLLPLGLFMTGMENSPVRFQIYAMHKSFGLLVFFLGIARLVWRTISPPPDHLESHADWEITLAAAAHFWLYVCIISMPLTGWLMSSAGEFPVPFFGLQMPHIIEKNEEWAGIFAQAHEVLAYTLLFILALHVAGALKHHLFDHDETLQRMTVAIRSFAVPALLIMIVGASFGASALFLARNYLEPQKSEASAPFDAEQKLQNPSFTTSIIPDAARAVLTTTLPPHGWAIVTEQSRLEFQANLYGTPFTGRIGNFGGTIIFDSENLASSRASIFIMTDSIKTGDADRDTNIQGETWLNTEKFPQAHFESTQFEKGGDNNYVAVGKLTIRDVTMPLALPFTLDIADGTAHAVGKVTFDRRNFNLGGEEWQDDKTVGHMVTVAIDITAIR